MTVEAVCPHCDTKYHLQPEMQGKSMRCPECKDVFVVSGLPEEVPYERIESAPPVVLQADVIPMPKAGVLLPPLAEQVPVMGIPVAAKAVPVAVALAMPEKKKKPKAKLEEPKIAVADWRDEPPPLAAPKPTAPAAAEFVLPKPRRNIWPAVLTGLIMLVVVIGAAAGGLYLYKASKREDNQRELAEAAFKERNFAEAAKLYEELLTQFPESQNQDRYRFFGQLSEMKNAFASPSLRADPKAARERWDAFITAFGSSPLAKTDEQGFGLEIYDSGRKVCENYANYAEDKLREYRVDLAKREPLGQAEAAVKESRELLPAVDRLRPSEVPPPEELQAKLNDLEGKFASERKRLTLIDPYRDLAEDPVEERIAEFTAMLGRNGISDDGEGRDLIAKANAKLRALMVPDTAPLAAKALNEVPEKTVVTVGVPVGSPKLSSPDPELQPETVFAAARGWLYALDADRAELLWATRTGRNELPMRVLAADGSNETAIIPMLVDGQAGLAARNARTGKSLWFQPLPAAVAGASAVVGNRVYVPLADAPGTICEFNIVTGERMSTFRIRQRIGPGLLAVPESKSIAVIAEARRIFILDTAAQDANGERAPLRLQHVLQTDHPELSLRVLPTFFGAGTPVLMLFQNEGTDKTRVRAVALPPLTGDVNVAESKAADLVAVEPLDGQLTMPATTDGERLAVVTDLGVFAVFKTNAPNNNDFGLFKMKKAESEKKLRDPQAALAVLGGEDKLWLFSGGQRTNYFQHFDPKRGFELTARGEPTPMGLPCMAPQFIPGRQAAAMIFRSEALDAWRIVLIDRVSGRIRWERTLGAVAAMRPALSGAEAVLVDDDGGAQLLTKDDAVRLADPAANAAAPTTAAAAENGIWTITPLPKERARVRLIQNGKLSLDLEVPLPHRPAGPAKVLGRSVLLPLKSGDLCRFDAAAKTFSIGPRWRSTAAPADAVCHITILNDTEFLANDGARRLAKWRWPESGEWAAGGEAIEFREPLAFAATMYVHNNLTRLIAADAGGNIALYDLANSRDALRHWKPNPEAKPAIAPGLPSAGFELFPRTNQGPLLVYIVNQRQIVALDPEQAVAAWVIARPESDYDLLGLTVIDDQMLVTDLAGGMELFDAQGKLLERRPARGRDQLPRSMPVLLNDRLIVPQADGSVIFLPAFRKAPQ